MHVATLLSGQALSVNSHTRIENNMESLCRGHPYSEAGNRGCQRGSCMAQTHLVREASSNDERNGTDQRTNHPKREGALCCVSPPSMVKPIGQRARRFAVACLPH